MIKKPLVAMDLASNGEDGGPFVSNYRVMNSNLKSRYDFKPIIYRTELGRGISIKRIRDLRNQLIQIKPDIVHFSGLQLSGFHIILACKLAGINRTVVTIHGFSGDAIDFHPLKKMLLTYIIEPFTLLLSNKIYGVSEYVVSRQMVRMFSNKCCGVIYNFAPSPYKSINGHTGIREELQLCSTDILAISVARITKDKGYHILETAISRFRNEETLKFIIVGKGNYLEEMRENLKDQISRRQVYFLGYRDDIQRILHDCNFFILPTLHETLSIALLEASVEGLALIATNTGGVPEIVENGYNGLLVPPGNIDALAEAIDFLYKESTKRQLYSLNASERIRGRFSNALIENKIDQVYQSLLNN